jgi:hypothetical protein
VVGPYILVGTVWLVVFVFLCSELRPEARALRSLLRRRGNTGTPHECGYCKPGVFTAMRDDGTTNATRTTGEGFSSRGARGTPWAERATPQALRRENSFTAHTFSGNCTGGVVTGPPRLGSAA